MIRLYLLLAAYVAGRNGTQPTLGYYERLDTIRSRTK